MSSRSRNLVRRNSFNYLVLLLVLIIQGCGKKAGSLPTADSTWQTVSTKSGHAQVEMPSPVSVQEQSVESSFGTVSLSVHKASLDGVFFSLWSTTFPQEVIEEHNEENSFLESRADTNERQKSNAQRKTFAGSEVNEYPSAEHHFSYSSGTLKDGRQYPSGFAKWRYRLVGNTVYAASVDVVDEAYAANPTSAEKNIQRFLDSFRVSEH